MAQNDQKPSKSSLLGKWLNRKQKEKNPGATGLMTRPQSARIPLSFGQQRLWFLQQLYPENPFYHYAETYLIEGVLDITLLKDCFKKIVEQQEILRTCFPIHEGQAVQEVLTQIELPILEEDLSAQDPDQALQSAKAKALVSAQKPFDLSKGPLLRLDIYTINPQKFLLLVNMHHIITDKWSMRILRQELSDLYQAQGRGEIKEMRQYADYAYWQRQQQTPKKLLAFWENKLKGELPILNLPTDHPRPLRPSFRGAYKSQSLPMELARQLKALALEHNTTLYVLILTAYKVLLSFYSQQKDILVGSPFTNRDQVELEKMMGFFNDTLVIRSSLEGDPRFVDLLAQVKENVMQAFNHKNMPFEELIQKLNPERYVSMNPLFQVMFLYHQVPEHPSFGSGIHFDYEPFDLGVAKFDLTLYIEESGNSLSAIFEYSLDLFEPSRVERMGEHLVELLSSIVQDPGQALSVLPILPPSETKTLLVDWNQTEVPYEEEKTVLDLFQQQVRAKGATPALVYGDQVLTYTELDHQSNALAALLLEKGLEPSQRVGLYFERSTEMIVGILGVLKAGGTYVPLDADYPEERLVYMMEEAELRFLLGQEALLNQLKQSTFPHLSFAEIKTKALAPSVNIEHRQAAYIIFTSGSSGRPKGVIIDHQNLYYSTQARFAYYPEPPHRFLLLSSFAFDSSVAGIFWTLCGGGTLVISEKRLEQDIEALAQLMEKRAISHSLMLPSLYDLLLRLAPLEKLRSLATVIVAGEACASDIVNRHFRLRAEAGLYNEYGPTEATVWATVHQVEEKDAQQSVPIGKPIANTQIYILDPQRRLCPLGVAGELYIGGKGISQGYLNRAELNRQKFMTHPFDETRGRLYKTGDLARYREDGNIEFLGRVDAQVKIRGNRIELDEIREVLLGEPQIEEALVLLGSAEGEPDLNSIESEDLLKILEKLAPEHVHQLLEKIENLSEEALQSMLEAMGKPLINE
ncbi:MAG: amino acid adenylation domain-containing protein [Bacteroidota bacterium]